MSNNRGNIALAREIALKDIAQEIAMRATILKANYVKPVRVWWNGRIEEYTDWEIDTLSKIIGYYFISASNLRKNLEITKLNKELGI